MKRRLVLLPALAVAALAAAATLALSDSDNGSAASGSEATAPGPVVARVNGEPISAALLDAQIQAQASRGQPVQRARALDELIDLVVLAQEAMRQGYTEQPEIAAAIRRKRAAILARHLLRAKLSRTRISEDELRQAYEQRMAHMDSKEYRASHILVETEKKARALIAKLEDGADFAALAREYSTGPTGSRGGDLGWFGLNQMVEPFSKAVAALEVGTFTTEPVKSRYGWHVIKLVDVRERAKPSFEQMKEQLRRQLVGQRIRAYIDSLRQDAKIEIVNGDPAGNADANGDPSGQAAPAAGADSGS